MSTEVMGKQRQKTRAGHDDQPAPRARGRPRGFDREAALRLAMELFWVNGYDGASISALTARMGIGTKSLYAAFGSKEQLFAEALRLYLDTFEDVLLSDFGKAATAREAIESLLRASVLGMTRPLAERPRGCMVTLTFFPDDAPEGLGSLLRTTRSGLFEVLLKRLEKGLDDGDLPGSTDIVALARYIQVVHSGMTIRSRDGADAAELTAIADAAMAAWDNLTVRPD